MKIFNVISVFKRKDSLSPGKRSKPKKWIHLEPLWHWAEGAERFLSAPDSTFLLPAVLLINSRCTDKIKVTFLLFGCFVCLKFPSASLPQSKFLPKRSWRRFIFALLSNRRPAGLHILGVQQGNPQSDSFSSHLLKQDFISANVPDNSGGVNFSLLADFMLQP